MESCLFCKIVRGEIPCNRVYEDAEVLAFHDIHPAAPIHFMLIPKLHIASLTEIEDQHLVGLRMLDVGKGNKRAAEFDHVAIAIVPLLEQREIFPDFVDRHGVPRIVCCALYRSGACGMRCAYWPAVELAASDHSISPRGSSPRLRADWR